MVDLTTSWRGARSPVPRISTTVTSLGSAETTSNPLGVPPVFNMKICVLSLDSFTLTIGDQLGSQLHLRPQRVQIGIRVRASGRKFIVPHEYTRNSGESVFCLRLLPERGQRAAVQIHFRLFLGLSRQIGEIQIQFLSGAHHGKHQSRSPDRNVFIGPFLSSLTDCLEFCSATSSGCSPPGTRATVGGSRSPLFQC